jgi:hypothetical protein
MWLWKRMDKIIWTDKITNEEFLERVGINGQMMSELRYRKKNWIGHILRGKGLLKELIEGKWKEKELEEDRY